MKKKNLHIIIFFQAIIIIVILLFTNKNEQVTTSEKEINMTKATVKLIEEVKDLQKSVNTLKKRNENQESWAMSTESSIYANERKIKKINKKIETIER